MKCFILKTDSILIKVKNRQTKLYCLETFRRKTKEKKLAIMEINSVVSFTVGGRGCHNEKVRWEVSYLLNCYTLFALQ